MKNFKKLASLLLAIIMVFTFTFTGVSVYADGENTVTVTPNTMKLDELVPVTITVSGGLEAGKTYEIRLAKTTKGPDESKLGEGGQYGYDFGTGSNWPKAVSVTTNANGGFSVTVDKHTSLIKETGKYTYCVMLNWGTKAVANFEVTPGKAKLTASATEVELGKDQPIDVTVTGGEDGLAAKKWYYARLYKVHTPKASGIGVDVSLNTSYKFSNGKEYVGANGVTTDANGGFSMSLTSHIEGVTETGYYVYAFMDSANNWKTVAAVGFEVIVKPTISLSQNSVELGAYSPLTLTVTGGKNGLLPNTNYKIRLAKSYNTYEKNAVGTQPTGGWGVVNNTYNGGTIITTDANGGFTKTLETHLTYAKEVGKYTFVVMAKANESASDYWDTKAVANFEVVAFGNHGSFTNTSDEFIIGKNPVKLTYDNLDITTYGTPEFKLYKWSEGWTFEAEKNNFIKNSWKKLSSTSGTVSFTDAQMESFGGEGKYVAVINGTGNTKFTEFVFSYIPNPKSMTIESTTIYRGEDLRIHFVGAQKGDYVAIFEKSVPNYNILGGSYRELNDGELFRTIETSKLAPGEYTVLFWNGNWDRNGQIDIVIEKFENDINYDAKVNLRDLVALKKMVAGLTDENLDADLNLDDEVNGMDLTYLRKVLLGIDPIEVIAIGNNVVSDTWDF